MDLNWVALSVAIIGSAGVGGVVTSIVKGVILARQGIAGREDVRRNDIIQQRDQALARIVGLERAADVADRLADAERLTRIRWQETAARLRRQLISLGHEPVSALPFEGPAHENLKE